jgi:hypothetical protein
MYVERNFVLFDTNDVITIHKSNLSNSIDKKLVPKCTSRESNPGPNNGNVGFYH